MILERNLRLLENNLPKENEQGDNVLRLKSGKRRLLPREVTDFVEFQGTTQDKLNFDRINKGYVGLRPGIYDKRRRKACMDRHIPVDVYHQV